MGASYDEDLEYLLDYAREDWVGFSVVNAVAGRIVGRDAGFQALKSAMLTVIGDLLDRGAVPGDLMKGEPAFSPWPGTKAQRLSRIEAEVESLGRAPCTGEVAWIHVPSS